MKVSVLLLFFAISVTCPSMARAHGGMLKRPTLALPENLPSGPAIKDLVAEQRYKFIGGVFLNARSGLQYAGDIDTLNAFLARLASCPGVKVRTRFELSESEAKWTFAYDPAADATMFRIVINTRKVAESRVRLPGE